VEPPSFWTRLRRGWRRIRQRADWATFAGPGWPDRIMQVAVTDRFHAKQGRSSGRWQLPAADGSGKKLVVYGGFLDRNRAALAPNDRAEGAVYDPVTGDWRRLPESPLSGQAIALAWDGAEVVAWDYELESAAFNPATEGWTALASVPLEHRDCLPAGTAAGPVVVAIHCGQAALFEPGQRTWRKVPAPAEAAGAPVWTGRELVLWQGPSGRSHDGTWIRPLAD